MYANTANILIIFLFIFSPLPVLALEFSVPCQNATDLGQCVVSIYNYALAIVGIVALVVFIWGGLEYFLAAGNITKAEKGRERIQAAILGIILLFSSYIILYTINPDLVKGSFKLLGIGGKEEEKAEYDNTIFLKESPDSSAYSGRSFSTVIEPTGGTPPYTFEIVEGSLPPGLQMESDGEKAVIFGTPNEIKTPSNSFKKLALISEARAADGSKDYTFRIKITDANGNVSFENITIKVRDRDSRSDTGEREFNITTTTPSPTPEPEDFARASELDFIQEIEISDKGSFDPVLFPAGDNINLKAKKLYKVKVKIDISKVSPFLVKSGSQWVAVPPRTKIISSTPIEYVDHNKITHNNRRIQAPTAPNIYPMELLKIGGYITSTHNYLIDLEKSDPKNKIFNLQPILSKGIAKGSVFSSVEGERYITVSSSDRGGLPSDSTLDNIYRLFESVPLQGYIYIPESEVGKKNDLTVELLAKGKDGKLVKDQRKVSLDIDGVNKPPVAYGQLCATTAGGKEECDFPHLRNVSWFSQWQLYLVSLDNRKTHDPDGDAMSCLWLNQGFAVKGFYPSPLNPSGCSSPGLRRANPYSSGNTAGDVWINWWPGLGRNTDKFETNYRTNERGDSDSFIITDGSLLSNVVRYEISTGKEPGKIYPLTSCNPAKDGSEKVIYASGIDQEYWCTRVAEPSAGSWLWRGALNLNGDSRDFGGCSNTIGGNAVLEYSPSAGGAKWKCERTGQYWRLREISQGSGGGSAVSAKLEPLVSKELKVKAGDKVVLRVRLVDTSSNKLNPSTISWDVLRIGAATNLNLPISASYDSNTKIAQAEFTAPNLSILFSVNVYVKLEGGGLGDVFENFRIDVSN